MLVLPKNKEISDLLAQSTAAYEIVRINCCTGEKGTDDLFGFRMMLISPTTMTMDPMMVKLVIRV